MKDTFISVVIPSFLDESFERDLTKITSYLNKFNEFEILVVDNQESNFINYEEFLLKKELKNIQLFSLGGKLNLEKKIVFGIDNCIGDYILVIDLRQDNVNVIPEMVDLMINKKYDTVYASCNEKTKRSYLYTFFEKIFDKLFYKLHGVKFKNELPVYRIMSREVINLLLSTDSPDQEFRWFSLKYSINSEIIYFKRDRDAIKKELFTSINQGLDIVFNSSYIPLRIFTVGSLFGAAVNILYMLYIIYTFINTGDVVKGWTSTSLQISGMFFLFSCIFYLLGEYLIRNQKPSNWRKEFYIKKNILSKQDVQNERLNVVTSKTK